MAELVEKHNHSYVHVLTPSQDNNGQDRKISFPDDGKDTDSADCSLYYLILLAIPRYATALGWASQWTIIGPLLESYVGSSSTYAVQLVGPICGIFLGPPIGKLSDHCTSKYGRRRPFFVVGTILCMIGWILTAFSRQIGEFLGDPVNASNVDRHYTISLIILLYVWVDIALTIVCQAAFLIVSDLAGNRKNLGFSIGQAAFIGGCLTIALFVFSIDKALNHLTPLLISISIILAIGVTIVCFQIKEKPLILDASQPAKGVFRLVLESLTAVWTGISTMPKMLSLYALIFFISFYGFNTYAGSKGQFFGLVVLKGDAKDASSCGSNCTEAQNLFNEGVKLAGGITDIISFIVGIIVTLSVPYITSKIGAKWVVTLSLIPQMGLIILAFSRSVTFCAFLAICVGTATNVSFALMIPIIMKLLREDQLSDLGTYIGSMNSFYSAGQLVCFALGASLVDATNLGHAFPILIGGIVTVIGFFVSAVFFKVDLKNF